MKHVVELKYTNPEHEHVSLRRRVETVNRVVEAQSAEEALNRAANQQRSLGFRIQSANIVEQKVEEPTTELISEAKGTADYPLLKKGEKLKPMKLKEGFDPDPSDIAAHLVKKHGKGKVTKDHVDAYEKDRDSNTAIDKEAVMKHVQKMSEEVEQIDEQSPAEIKAKYYHDQFNKVKPVKAYDKEGKLVGHYRSMDHAKQMKPGHTYKVEEDVELDEAQKKLRPSYWKAEWRLGTQSDVDKNNKKIFDRLAKTDPVKAAAFHDNLMKMKKKDVKEETGADKRDAGYKMPAHVAAAQKKFDAQAKGQNKMRPQAGTLAAAKMKKEAVDPGSVKVVNKKVKAAEKMINAAKGKANRVDLKPTLDLEKHKD